MSLDLLLDRLEAVRPTGEGQWQARCPAHDDRSPSLSVGTGRDDRVLIHCQAGCELPDVLDALELEARDLFADNGKPWTNAGLRSTGATAESDGRWLLGGIRYLPGATNGSKALAAKGATRDLYPDPATVEGETLYVVEGEPDAVTGASLGIPTVALPGAGKWRSEWAPRLAKGRQRVVVIPDADEPGRKAAERVASAVAEHCADVRILDLEPSRGDGADLSDWAAAVRDDAGRAYVRELLVKASRDAPRLEREAPASANGSAPAAPSGRRVVLTRASAITPEPLRWLWDRRLPLRGLSLIAGEPGLGKSTLTAELAADVTRGRLDGDLHGQPSDVLIATAEDHFASVVWGRLTAAGAVMDRVHRLQVEDRDGEELLTLPDDVAEIELRCEELAAAGRPVALVAVDPVTAFIGGSVDTHRDAAVRRVLAPLAGLAERQQLAAVGIAHLNKDTAGKLLTRVGGSVAFGAAPRSVLAFARHPDDPDGDQGTERVIVHAKSNHGRYAPSLAGRIETRIVPTVGEVSRLVIAGECEVSPDDLGAQGGEHHERDAAADWLADELADGEWHESRVVRAAGQAAGHSERTLQRTKQRLGIEDRREGFPAISEWRLPVAPTPIGATGATLGGATRQSRMDSGIAPTPPPSPANPPDGGATASTPALATPAAGEVWIDPDVPDHRLLVVEVVGETATLHAESGDGASSGEITLLLEDFDQLRRAGR